MPICLHFQQLKEQHGTHALAKEGPPDRVSDLDLEYNDCGERMRDLKVDQGRSTGPSESGEQSVPQRPLPAVPGTTCSVPLQGLSMDAKPTLSIEESVSFMSVVL